MDKSTDSDSSSDDSSDSSTPPSPVRIKSNRYKNILSNEDEDEDGEVAADNNSDSDSDKGEDEDEDEDADEYEDEDNDEDEDDDSNGEEIAPDKNNNEEDPDPSGKAEDKGFWKKLRVVMKHQPVSRSHCLNLPHDKLRPPTNRDRVRVSRQKQNPAQKEVARIKNKNRSMVLYHKQTPCQREIALKQRSERKKKRRAMDNANNPNFRPWKKLDHLTPQEKEKRKSIKRQQQQTERIAKSYYIAPTTDDIATSLAVKWCNTDFLDMYKDLIVRIAPLSNPAKHTHQTGQPIRIFYSRTNKNTTWDENVNERALYGVAGIMPPHAMT